MSYVGILWKLRLALVVCFFIRNRRWAYIVCIGFTNAEYHVIRVDFKETAFGFGRLFFYKESAFCWNRLYCFSQ